MRTAAEFVRDLFGVAPIEKMGNILPATADPQISISKVFGRALTFSLVHNALGRHTANIHGEDLAGEAIPLGLRTTCYTIQWDPSRVRRHLSGAPPATDTQLSDVDASTATRSRNERRPPSRPRRRDIEAAVKNVFEDELSICTAV